MKNINKRDFNYCVVVLATNSTESAGDKVYFRNPRNINILEKSRVKLFKEYLQQLVYISAEH